MRILRMLCPLNEVVNSAPQMPNVEYRVYCAFIICTCVLSIIDHLRSTTIMSDALELNCFALGDSPDNIFTVKILRTKSVGTLKDAIKEKKGPAFRHVDASSLELWKVDLPGDGSLLAELEQFSFDDKTSLWPLNRVSDIFKDVPVESRVHIVVRCPRQSEHFRY
jgi:hypothetical protein